MRFRHRWWEVNKVAQKHAERNVKKYENAGGPWWMLKLPKNFTCWHFNKIVPIEDRLRLVLTVDLAGPEGQLEYGALELERILLRKVR